MRNGFFISIKTPWLKFCYLNFIVLKCSAALVSLCITVTVSTSTVGFCCVPNCPLIRLQQQDYRTAATAAVWSYQYSPVQYSALNTSIGMLYSHC